MLGQRLLIVSDAHLGKDSGRAEAGLQAFLEAAPDLGDCLLINGDLFARVVAFSPGFLVADRRRGSPRLFVSHGTRDAILPIETCGRRVVREARREGYDVRFVEFDGGHTVPGDVAGAAMDWILAPS